MPANELSSQWLLLFRGSTLCFHAIFLCWVIKWHVNARFNRFNNSLILARSFWRTLLWIKVSNATVKNTFDSPMDLLEKQTKSTECVYVLYVKNIKKKWNGSVLCMLKMFYGTINSNKEPLFLRVRFQVRLGNS